MARAFSSLRGRVALVATATFASVLLLVGAASLASFADRERQRVDDSLESRPSRELARALGAPEGPPGPDAGGRQPGPDSQFGPPVLRPRGEYVRLSVDGEEVRGVDVPEGLPVPGSPGLRTLSARGVEYRSLARMVAPRTLIETGVDLSDAQARIDELRNRLLLLGLAGLLLVAALSWWLAGLALRPLARLGDAADDVGGTKDLSRRIDAGTAAAEVERLTGSINSMLARLEASAEETTRALEATRRFAGDAGHELRTPMTSLQANLGAIRRNPDIDRAELEAALGQMDRDSARMMRMLGTLQALARGDSAAALPKQPVELAGLLGSAVAAARRRHPGVSWNLVAPEDEVEISGWPDGLSSMIDNLLENAARHGRSGGEVTTTLTASDGEVEILVDDDGPGIEPESRERVFERFERGEGGEGDGTGLGLALVRQQARLHHGDAVVEQSPAGGARVRVTLSTGPG